MIFNLPLDPLRSLDSREAMCKVMKNKLKKLSDKKNIYIQIKKIRLAFTVPFKSAVLDLAQRGK